MKSKHDLRFNHPPTPGVLFSSCAKKERRFSQIFTIIILWQDIVFEHCWLQDPKWMGGSRWKGQGGGLKWEREEEIRLVLDFFGFQIAGLLARCDRSFWMKVQVGICRSVPTCGPACAPNRISAYLGCKSCNLQPNLQPKFYRRN